MKKIENKKTKNSEKIKKETEKIKEIIRKETGIYIKKMNSRNLMKEFERFYYVMAADYYKCLTAITYLDEIETDYFICIKDDYLSDFVTSMSAMMNKIFSDEEKDYSDIMNGILRMLISEDKIVNIIKDAMPNWVVLRNKIKPGLVNIVPLYDYLTEYYLNYSYKFNIEEDIKPFIEGLNKLFGELVEDEDFIYTSTHLEEKEEITEE